MLTFFVENDIVNNVCKNKLLCEKNTTEEP